jgi:serine/threonine protein kinase
MHKHGIMHLDIKPENFLVKADNTVKLGDFGHSVNFLKSRKRTRSKHTSEVSINDVDEGDCSYVAPELLDFQPKVSFKADIFSLGLTLTEALTGNMMPKNGQLWLKIRTKKITSIFDFPNDKAIGKIINRMCTRKADQRCTLVDILSHPKLLKKFNFLHGLKNI